MTTDHPTKSPAFQFYPKDFLSDGNQAGMSLQETGAYIRLICFCWNDGSIPDDPARIGRMIGATPREMKTLWPAIRPFFIPADEGRLTHPRVEQERLKQAEYRRRQGDAAHKRWQSRGNAMASSRDASGISQTPQPHIPHASSSSSSSSPSASASPEERRERVLPARAQGSGVMAGTLPRDHLHCRPPCIRVCVSQKQHAILRERHGGTDAEMDAFYAEVRGNLHGPVGQRPWEFWEAQFNAKFGPPVVNSKTAGNIAAAARFVARGQS